MADELEEKEEQTEEFDAAAAAAEFEAESSGESETEETETEDDTESGEAEEKKPAAEDDDDDEKFLTENKGRTIPYSAFQKKYQKWKEREAKAQSEYKRVMGEYEGYKKSTSATPEQLDKFKRLETVFGNLDSAATKNPWLANALMAIGQGKEPDWRALHLALENHVKTLPQGDPILARQVQEIQERQAAFEHAQLSNTVTAHVQRENEEIRKLIGDDQAAWEHVNQIAAASVPRDGGDASSLPNRVEIAKKIVAWADARVQAKLKTRVPLKPKAGADIRGGRGAAAAVATDDDPPELGTEEYRRWATGQL